MCEASASFVEAIELYECEEYKKSIPIFEDCLRNGEQEAGTFLGTIYEDGLSVRADTDKALAYYLAGARLGSLRSMYHAGVIHGNEGRFDSAIKLLKEASGHDFVLAQATLGFLYREGPFNLRSRENAKRYLRLASSNSHILSTGAYCNLLLHQGNFKEFAAIPFRLISIPINTILYLVSRDDDIIDTSPKSVVKSWSVGCSALNPHA